MKKLVLSVALLAGAFAFSFGQQKNVKEAKRIANAVNPDFAQAEQLINEALENEETMNDALTWDAAGLIQKRYVEEEQKKQYLSKEYDTVGVYNSIAKMFDYFAKCDELAEIPNEKGKIKNKFRKDNGKTLLAYRPELINGGVYYFNENKDQEALDFFTKYIQSPQLPIFEGADLISTDDNFKTIAYYATLAATRLENFEAVTQLAPLAVADTQEGMQALELLSHAYRSLGNDTELIATLKQGIEMFPEHLYFFGNLVDYSVSHEKLDDALNIANAMVEKDPNNSYYIYVKGFILHHKKDYEKAAECFKKAIELDPTNAEAYSNLGLAYTIQAQELLDSVPVDADLNSAVVKKANAKAEVLYKEALPFYEKARELKPDEDNLWARGLYLIYYKLNMADKFEEMEKIINP